MRQRTVFRNNEIPGRIHALQPFLSDGALPDGTRRWSGHSGPAVTMGHLPARYRSFVRQAIYVVYSYDTPIAWVREPDRLADQGDELIYEIPDVGYSVTTGQHQMAVMEAWADHMRRQGNYRRWPGSHREVVEVPGNAEVYGRTIRARAGGMDGVRPGDTVGSTRDSYDDAARLGPLTRGWRGHRAHP